MILRSQSRVRNLAIATITLLSVMLIAGHASAASGGLDPSFDLDGLTLTNLGAVNDSDARAMAIQGDGKIVVAGHVYNGTDYDFAVARYNTDGSLDADFDGDGIATTDFGLSSNERAIAAVVQTDGKIMVAGYVSNVAATYYAFALARYNTDGSVDPSFDGDGIVTTDFGLSNDDRANAVAIQNDGKSVVAGYAYSGGTSYDFAVARYNADGSLDPSFDGDGLVTTDFGLTINDAANAVAIQSDGRIVVAGLVNNGVTSYDYGVARYNADGSLDASFDSDGIVTTDFGLNQSDEANAIAIQSDGKIVVAGSVDNGATSFDYGMARYNSGGSLDASFDGDGIVTTDFGLTYNEEANAVAIQNDGKIVVVGLVYNGTTNDDYGTARYNTDGSLDAGFDGDGIATTDFGPNNDDRANAVAIQSDGKIVLAGTSSGDFGVARLLVTEETSCPLLPLPQSACLVAAKVQLQVKNTGDPAKSQLKWKWGAGAAFDQLALGTPNATTSYALCVYDTSSSTPTIATSLDVAPGALWLTKDPKGWNYIDKPGTSDGVQKLQLKTGDAGKTKAQVKSSGINLPMPTSVSGSAYFAQDPKVVVQLISSEGMCLTSEFDATSTLVNDGAQFKAKAP